MWQIMFSAQMWPCGGFEITIKTAVFLFQNWKFGGGIKVSHFLGYDGIKEVSVCPVFIIIHTLISVTH
ncbi:hypothetical protein CS538_09400 [Clostridium combesii]|uniref:Uncharacterized protein n=1 Tax=Clostridium combesii TaxID=39481 RepID=A0A2G7HGV8_9CLOT|nr:hypothetical protein CS538_09400 [Clostridium combesii]